MNKSKLRTELLFFTILIFSCNNETGRSSRVEELPYYNEASFTPIWLAKDNRAVENIHKISPFSLLNQEGDTITEKTFEGKIYVTDFFFTSCPGICPKMTANMEILQNEFLEDEDVLLLSHSVTPGKDSVPILKAYAQNRGIISTKWHLATGSQEEIYRLGRLEYFVEEDLGVTKDVDEFLHTENFVLVDRHRHIRGIYNGLNKSAINQLIADIKTLRKEK
ncbi:MAG: SCO family protein [Bacteroidia bacterium]|nr:SCO family protein [Bacteroidia bacterium]